MAGAPNQGVALGLLVGALRAPRHSSTLRVDENSHLALPPSPSVCRAGLCGRYDLGLLHHGGPLSPADLDGRFEVVAASDSKGNSVTIHLPDQLPPNTYVVLVNERRDRLIMLITPQEERPDAEGRTRITISGTKIRLQRPPGQTVLTTTHGMLVGFPGGSPAKDELEKIIPSPFSTRQASDQAVLEALHDRADDIHDRFPGCVVRIEAFDVRTGDG